MSRSKHYLNMSKEFRTFTSEFLIPEQFLHHFLNLSVEEQKGLLNHYLVDGRASVLKDNPLLYDQIISYMAEIANVPVSHVKIIGSFKTGFCTGEEYGRPFDCNRDIDMTIIDEKLFNNLVLEYEAWKQAYNNGECCPNNTKEESYWDANKEILSKKIRQGFIDTYLLPNRDVCPTIKHLHEAAFQIEIKLRDYYNIKIKNRGVSIRVYKTYH